jgi:hypothetical protein
MSITRRKSRILAFVIFSFLLICFFSIKGHAYEPQNIPDPEKNDWKSFTGVQAGEALLKLRASGKTSDFAARFLLFFDQGRTKREILDLLNVVDLPLKHAEVEAIGEILAFEVPDEIRNRNAVDHGYSIECRGTPGTRISLVFLSDEEKRVYKTKFVDNMELQSPVDEEIFANLEGRLCVWAKKRKIHLGGPHFIYERVARILSYPSEFD